MTVSESSIALPPVPDDQLGLGVAAWSEPVGIDTYPVDEPSMYPAFLDRRVYQGSSGRVYPLPFYDSVGSVKHPQQWQAIHVQNDWIRLTILPELGGRIHVAVDRTTGRDLFYRNNVIKPALVGLTGPWISGGVEFNWPQHHRPGTFLPVDTDIERRPDGSVTVWCSEHDPFNRMKGMHGIRLYPDRAVIEVVVRLYNRTTLPQTFLWWANVAVRVDDDYQSFFPSDVTAVADHAKRAVSSFPRADGRYYGVDYPDRVDADHPDADRLDWWRNIPVPTSYMCVGSRGDFFGGYDHGQGLGFVHWADHHVSPGKKQWTWGNSEFGRVWEHNLTDGDGPYIELMAGVYTDNQPDFSFLAPGETKTFSQFWYPIHRIGPATDATVEAAGRLDVARDESGAEVAVAIAVTRPRLACRILVQQAGRILADDLVSIEPGSPALRRYPIDGDLAAAALTVTVSDGGETLLVLRGAAQVTSSPPMPAAEPPAPATVESADALYLTGVHLDQYRHATRSPEPYWRRALAIDAGDSRTNTAMAHRLYRAGRFAEAEKLLLTSTARLTELNPNPVDGTAHYFLGIVQLAQDNLDAAYDSLSTAAWIAGWRAPAHYGLAQIDSRRHRWADALDHLDRALKAEAEFLQAADLRVLVLRRLDRGADANRQLATTLSLDPLDNWARHLADLELTCDAEAFLDLALDYVGAGFAESALSVLDQAVRLPRAGTGAGNALPLLHFHRASVLRTLGRDAEAEDAVLEAGQADPLLCFPGRLADYQVLQSEVGRDPHDGRAAALLGHWLYAHDRHAEAVLWWNRALEQVPDDVVVLRGLALAAVTVQDDVDLARRHYDRAIRLAPDDARLWFERDQLCAREAVSVSQRLSGLESRPDIVAKRDDLTVVLAELLIVDGRPAAAIELFRSRVFQPWEGGEGRVCQVWAAAHFDLARHCLSVGDLDVADTHLQSALHPPLNLAETWHPLDDLSQLELMLGDAAFQAGDIAGARSAWSRAAAFAPSEIEGPGGSTSFFYSTTALRRLNLHTRAEAVVESWRRCAVEEDLIDTPDYFATSLPQLLLFPPKPGVNARRDGLLVAAQWAALMDRPAEAQEALSELSRVDPADLRAHELSRSIAAEA
ncbi:hypothetical protein SAMN04515671_1655 [Nakamurella panacisegetis]|uniref:DUF5107 domain-containing protein n=1 Tax=Nakamurella panacisegetis TaxID=1090615 RepID=A0A1H0LG62_9ACTN|nr:DUF5107 domain-containing protein [Nakamurella panacisegetis]SDO67102.1 hypothetical protein SAMN04515671_1655 [Nakamurella panacisegetis]